MVAAGALVASASWAQEKRIEISATAGWTFSDGVNVGASDTALFRVDPKDAFSWGARFGFLLSEHAEVGGLFNMQATDLEASGGPLDAKLPQTLYNYHGYFAYNFGAEDAKARPYVLGGLGATQFGSLNAGSTEIGGETKFSTTWAAGVKIYPTPAFGIRLEGRWTPTYVKSDPEGYWCDPYWGCYTVGDAEYANQFELSGGISFRF
jgi:opacity protein-like surface antigen